MQRKIVTEYQDDMLKSTRDIEGKNKENLSRSSGSKKSEDPVAEKNIKVKMLEEEKGVEESNLLDEPLMQQPEFYGVSKAYGNSAAFIQSPPEENKVHTNTFLIG
jgi:hypothetical protein